MDVEEIFNMGEKTGLLNKLPTDTQGQTINTIHYLMDQLEKASPRSFLAQELLVKLYLSGLSSGEIVALDLGFNSRQNFFNHVQKVNETYTKDHKEKRKRIYEELDYYYGFELVEKYGKLTEETIQWFKNEPQGIKYYIDQGGQKTLWNTESLSQSQYKKYFEHLNQQENLLHYFKHVSDKENKNNLDLEISQMTKDEKLSLRSSFGRWRREEIKKDILTGKTEREVKERFNLNDKTYKKHLHKVKKDLNDRIEKDQGHLTYFYKVPADTNFQNLID